MVEKGQAQTGTDSQFKELSKSIQACNPFLQNRLIVNVTESYLKLEQEEPNQKTVHVCGQNGEVDHCGGAPFDDQRKQRIQAKHEDGEPYQQEDGFHVPAKCSQFISFQDEPGKDAKMKKLTILLFLLKLNHKSREGNFDGSLALLFGELLTFFFLHGTAMYNSNV